MGRRLLCVAGVGWAAVAATGRKLILRERDTAEHFAGIFAATRRITALLGWHAVVQHGNNQLGIPLQAYDRKLSQSYQQIAGCPAGDQFFIKYTADSGRNLCY